MISHKHRCIFIHIPKTAGSSIQNALRAANADFQPFNAQCFDRGKIPFHASGYNGINPWDIKHYPSFLLDTQYQSYFKFCFVRDPWDLMVSCYSWWTQQTKMPFRQLQGKILEQIGFSNFVYSFYTDYINEVFHCGLGQSYWLLNQSNAINVNYIGRFEQLQEHFDEICDKIGINTLKLPQVNQSLHRDFSEYYDANTASLIANKFQWDVKLFGYQSPLA